MLVSETHFTERSHLHIPNYYTYYTTHPDGTAHGGTAILVKNKIKHYQVSPYRKEEIQATCIILEVRYTSITIAAVYCPPKDNIKEDHFINFIKTLGNRFIAGGDYNAKHVFWGSRLTLPRGRELFKVVENLGLGIVSSGHPTYWPSDNGKIPDLLDFCITKGISSN